MNSKFWQNKRVLVTGHTGFKGSWLSLWLQSKGAHIIGYSLPPPTNPSLFEIAYVAKEMKSITGDVRDLEHLRTIVNQHKPEIIIHMAAQSLVRNSYKDPIDTYSTNVMGTVNVLEAGRHVDSLKVILIITSDKCYENNEWIWGYRENDPMGGHDPYSISKGCAELVTAAYRNSYFSTKDNPNQNAVVATTRAGNVIGGGDWAIDRLIPDAMKALMEDQSVVVRNPDAIRPWQHVLEPLNGYLKLAEHMWAEGPEFAQAWNFGPYGENAKPVSWIVEGLSGLWGEGATWTLNSAQQPHEDTHLKLDSSKANTLLRWCPKLDLFTALEWIVEWYRAYKNDEDMRDLTIAQISRYEQEKAE